jgi:hypothetical protein
MATKEARHTELRKFLKCSLGIVMGMFLGNRGKRPLQVIIERLSGDKAYFCILQSISGLIISNTEGILFAGALRLFQTHFSGFCCLFSQKCSPPLWNTLHERFVKTLILNQNILFGISLREFGETSYKLSKLLVTRPGVPQDATENLLVIKNEEICLVVN